MDTDYIRETIRTYFVDVITGAEPFDYDAEIDSLEVTITSTEYPNPLLYDTIGEPSIYGSKMINDSGNYQYMISVEGDGNEDLNSYLNMKQYVDNQETVVKVYDLRYSTKQLIKELTIEATSLRTNQVDLLEHIYVEEVLTETKRNRLFFGKRSLLNLIKDNSFYFKNRFGGMSKSSYKNVMMLDIENNRKILNNSVRNKMLLKDYSDFYKGVAGIVGTPLDEDSGTQINTIFTKYDHYDIEKKYEIVTVIPENTTPIFEDIEPSKMLLISASLPNSYAYNDSKIIKYIDFFNSSNLPKFKAIHTLVGNESRYFIFDVIRGSVPEYRSTSASDNKSLCLLDVYDKIEIVVGNKRHKLTYSLSQHFDSYVLRSIVCNNKTYFIKLSDDERGLFGYLYIPSNSESSFNNVDELFADFPFSDLGINALKENIYPKSFKPDGSGGSIVDEWAMDLYINENKSTVEFKTMKSSEAALFSRFLDTTTLTDKVYFKMPITLDINNRPTELIKNVVATMRAKRVKSSNDYKFETYGY
jgi:hypothetical protein